jgi:hypothetical protein
MKRSRWYLEGQDLATNWVKVNRDNAERNYNRFPGFSLEICEW